MEQEPERRVLEDHQEPVSIGVKAHEGRAGRRAGRVDVLHDRARLEEHLPARQAQPPAEVGVLVVHEEALVEEPGLRQRLAPIERGRAAGGEDLLAPVVATVVGLTCAAVPGAPVAEEQAAGALDDGGPVGEDELGLHGGRPGLAVGRGHQRGQPARSRPGVVVEQHPVLGLKLPLYGDGSAIRDYVHVEDHCRGIDLALRRGTPGAAYNLGTGVETSGREVAATVVELTGLDESSIEQVVDRAGHDYRYALDVSQAREELGWSAGIGFREGMERTVRWYRDNQDWWRPLRSGEYWEFYRRNYKPLEVK
ncbi:MAG: NAD-dependent epimerase/dehydratase family protein [Chloroflexi bacterium]|nr:MAG: NAD-dependent epimerase/dehydratase family protein [Chloroflexota bacterium]